MKRRDFLIATSAIAVTAWQSSAANAQQTLDPNSPSAVALGYVANHRKVDTARWMKKSGDSQGVQRCAKCALFVEAENGRGSCSIFSGRLVAADGWCNAWTQR